MTIILANRVKAAQGITSLKCLAVNSMIPTPPDMTIGFRQSPLALVPGSLIQELVVPNKVA